MLKRTKSLCLLFAFFLGSAAAADDQTQWKFISKKNGVYTWKHEIPGSDMPGFRGQVFIEASIDDILKTMLDWKRHPEWMYGCKESQAVKVFSPTHGLLYNRLHAPWPVWDRDVIVDTVLERSADQLLVRFQNVNSPQLHPVPKRVVRLPKLVGFYKLSRLEPAKTKVLYQVESDAGGSLPQWLSVYAAEALPYETLNRLRNRVEGKE